jgi:hypothetical protein
MKQGSLAQYFEGVAAKRLSAVEVDKIASNQHEFNGVAGLRRLLGEPEGKSRYEARFLYVTDQDEEPVVEDGFLTWYDARQKARLERGVQRSEYRLYFPANRASQCTAAGDLLVIAKRPQGTLLAIVAEHDSTIAQQLIWLFGLSEVGQSDFFVRDAEQLSHEGIELTSRLILDSIGVVVEDTAVDYLEGILTRFGSRFPSTKEFSAYARSTLPNIQAKDDPDAALMSWIDREEVLFRTLERHIVTERLAAGFGDDVDAFMDFSLSVQNRRKSRAGLSLENHLSVVFTEFGVRYSRAALTERRSKPDFLFPGQAEYHDATFDPSRLTMLGSKSTCKDRWRQVLAEAARIETKHLLTLEAAISTNQTDEMRAQRLQLVLPYNLHESYLSGQRSWLMSLADFLSLVLDREESKR